MNHFFDLTGKRKGESSSSNIPISSSLPVETTIPKKEVDAQFIALSVQGRRSISHQEMSNQPKTKRPLEEDFEALTKRTMRSQELNNQPTNFQEAHNSSRRVLDQDFEDYTKQFKEPKLHNYNDEDKFTGQQRYNNLDRLDNFDNSRHLNDQNMFTGQQRYNNLDHLSNFDNSRGQQRHNNFDNFDNSRNLNVELKLEKENARLRKENSRQLQRISTLEERVATLMNRYKELANLRYTEPEAEIYKLIEASKKREEGYAKLEQSIKRLELSQPMSGNQSELVQKIQQLQQENQEKKARIHELEAHKGSFDTSEFFKELSGFSVKNVKKQNNGNLYMCEMVCSLGTHKFFLLVSDQQDKKVEYSPIMDQPRNPLIESALPEYLQCEIEFDKPDLPLLFGRMELCLHSRASS